MDDRIQRSFQPSGEADFAVGVTLPLVVFFIVLFAFGDVAFIAMIVTAKHRVPSVIPMLLLIIAATIFISWALWKEYSMRAGLRMNWNSNGFSVRRNQNELFILRWDEIVSVSPSMDGLKNRGQLLIRTAGGREHLMPQPYVFPIRAALQHYLGSRLIECPTSRRS